MPALPLSCEIARARSLEPAAPVPEVMEAGAAWIGAETEMVEPAGAPVVKKVPPYAPLTAEASALVNESIVRQVAVDHAARAAADLEQAAHLAARRPAAGRRAGPGRGLVGDDRVGGAGRAVDERDVRRAAVEVLDGDLAVLRELIEQQVAAVHQVVRVIAVDHELADRRVQVGELRRDLVDLAAGDLGDLVVLPHRALLRRDHLRAHGVDRVGQALGLLHDGLLGGIVVGGVGEVRPRLPELRQLGVDAGVAGLGERELRVVEVLGARLPVGEVRVLRAVLRVDERVADAAEADDVHAVPEMGAGLVGGAGRLDLLRERGRERGLLARVADGRRVRDVVAGGVEHPLLRDQAAQRRLHPEKGRDRHGGGGYA